ncbi:MAG: hypothetical protein AAF654_03640 [Myxococcota bacterium]
MDHWDLDEAECVFSGYNVLAIHHQDPINEPPSELRVALVSASRAKRLGDESPRAYVEWALKKGIELPAGLVETYRAFSDNARTQPHGNAVNNAEKREKALGLALAIALDWNGKSPPKATELARRIHVRWPGAFDEANRLAERTIADLIRKYQKHLKST